LEGVNCCGGVRKCLTLPNCAPVQAECAAGVCCGGIPRILDDDRFLPFLGKRLAVATSRAVLPTNPSFPSIQSEAVVRIVDLDESIFVLDTNIAAPKYHGPAGNEWTHKRLGSVFGITLDASGNIFVAATSAYNGDSFPAPGPFPSGTIWRLDGGTGMPTVFAQLPNFQDPGLVADGYPTEAFPALGDVAYDCRFNQFFATNLEDGKIYRLKGGTANMIGSIVSTYDPFTADDSKPGFAPLSERLVAVKVHNNRVYYSVWKEDCGNPSPTETNEVWSVGLNPTTGDFLNDNRLELQLPPLAGMNFANPIFDISFSREGKLLLAERTMHCDPFSTSLIPNAFCGSASLKTSAAATLSAAHAARVLEYECGSGEVRWKLSDPFQALPYKFNVGNLINSTAQCEVATAGWPANAAGGVDYDYSKGPKYTVWCTGDSLLPYTGANPPYFIPYGLQGFMPVGGGMTVVNGPTTAVAIDLNDIMLGFPNQFSDKAEIGDVEIVCPAQR
jgi:hypothetical protein